MYIFWSEQERWVINKKEKVLKNPCHLGIDKFQEAFIIRSEGVNGIRINVNLPNVFAIYKKGNDDFRFHVDAAGNVVILGTNIGHKEVLVAQGNLPADTLAKRDACMLGWLSRIRAQQEFLFLTVSKIKAYPIVMGNFLS